MKHKKHCSHCLDRILPKQTMRFYPTELMFGGRVRAISPIGKSWINGSTLRVKFFDGSPAQHNLVREQAGWWSQHANLKFDFNQDDNAEIRIHFDPDDGAWSYIGTDNKSIPFDQPTMNLGFLSGGTAAHEIGHAIGLAHEHSSPDGGIQWNEAVVLAELAQSPNFWDEDTVRHNVFDKYSASHINGTVFDPDSIMLYAFPASWTRNGIATHSNEVLSTMDKQFIGGAKMYPKLGATTATSTELKINAEERTQALISKFGQEDIFRFIVAAPGRFEIDTLGPTDVVMKLFGPDIETALITEDDDSGRDLNASIAVNLMPGQYFVQIRHYNRASGVGKYSIKVKSLN